MLNLVEKITKDQIRTDLPEFRVGDTVIVGWKVIEGKRERVQDFEQLNYDKVKNIILHTKNADDETKTLILNSLKQLLLKQKKVNN